MGRVQRRRVTLATGGAVIALFTASLAGRPAYAIDFDVDGWSGSADTTLLSSGTVRTEADRSLSGKVFGGKGTFVPTDGSCQRLLPFMYRISLRFSKFEVAS